MKKILFMFLVITATAAMGQVEGEILTQEDRDKVEALRRAEEESSDTLWTFGVKLGLNFSQSYFSNWAAGGQNSLSATAITSFTANYKKDRHSWENSLDMAYGQLSQDDREPIKTDDRFDFTSKYGYALQNPAWYYTALVNFRTQFAPGYTIEDGVETGKRISDALAPAYSIVSLGADFMPNKKFSALLSPVTSKITIVTIDRLAIDYGVEEGENVRFEVGAFVKLAYNNDIFENVNLQTRVDLFSNYTNNPENIDVNWETLITMKVNSWLAATLTTQLIYDDDVLIVTGTREILGEDGTINTIETKGPRTQFREVFALGLSFSF